jgi:transcriptional regulator with XRE-family HTH domain
MELKTLLYNQWHDVTEESVMPKRKMQLKKGEESFGERLERLRKAAGYSLRELAADVGISHRMLVYYEKHSENPPAHLLPQLAKVLGVSADQLLGLEKEKRNGRVRDTKLWRRFSQLEKLPPPERKPIIQVMDAFLKSKHVEKKAEPIMPEKRNAAWSRKMQRVVSELRKGAEKYSDEEIDRIVDETVKAVRGRRNRSKERARA